jgi:hypothetical protein
MTCPLRALWKQAEEGEIELLLTYAILDLVQQPAGSATIGRQWVHSNLKAV